MCVRAEADQRFLLRFLIIALICLGVSLWFFYDAVIGYPNRLLPRAVEYERIVDLPPRERARAWRAIAEEHDWPLEEPYTLARAREKIVEQYVWGALAGLIGLPMLLWYLWTRTTWVEGTETGLRTSWGKQLTFDQITKVDKKKWEDKGIAKIYYLDGNRTRRFILDDFKYKRQPIDQMMETVESKVSPDLIVNDKPKKPAEPDNAEEGAELADLDGESQANPERDQSTENEN